jgi:hypothetical protein
MRLAIAQGASQSVGSRRRALLSLARAIIAALDKLRTGSHLPKRLITALARSISKNLPIYYYFEDTV